MLLGCIADDFTGASDLANMLTKNGMRSIQFVGIPQSQAQACDAAIISLKSRSNPVDQAIKQSLAALDWLLAQGATQILFKYCSTFDSKAEGNIGQVAQALMARMGVEKAIVCPVFPANGRTLYNGHLFVKEMLLNESGMENHPVTPMKDANIVRHLQAQTTLKVGLVPFASVRQGAAAIEAAIKAHSSNLLVVDAVSDEDLLEIDKAIASHKFITGGSGIALGLPKNFKLSPDKSNFKTQKGFAVALSGSCSLASQQQVKIYAASHPALFLDAREILTGVITPKKTMKFVQERLALSPLIYSTTTPEAILATQKEFGALHTSETIEAFFGELAVLLVEAGVTRLAVGGGETSGAVVQALEISHFHIGAEIAEGVPALLSEGQYSIALALKSGNFGQPDFFERAIKALGVA